MASTLSQTPKQLPKGVFLLCGNRAWAGIPPHLLGGPCTLRRLTLFTPNMTQINNWRNKTQLAHKKRDFNELDENCDSEIFHLSHLKRSAVCLFLPWVAVAKALGELGTVECWVAKQANLTLTAISDLLEDEEITRKATLQNRAAIDYLLLLHNHECQEFKGLCCFNLSSKAQDVRQAVQRMQELVHQIKEESKNWLEDLLSGWELDS